MQTWMKVKLLITMYQKPHLFEIRKFSNRWKGREVNVLNSMYPSPCIKCLYVLRFHFICISPIFHHFIPQLRYAYPRRVISCINTSDIVFKSKYFYIHKFSLYIYHLAIQKVCFLSKAKEIRGPHSAGVKVIWNFKDAGYLCTWPFKIYTL